MLSSARLFRFKAGDHMCVFYRDDAYMFELLASYISQGLQQGERCFCAQKAEGIEQLKANLAYLGIDVTEEVRRGSLEIHTQKEVYLSGGSFTPRGMMQLLTQAIAEAKRRGFSGLRTAGEMSWSANGACDCDQLTEYEALVNEAFPKHPAIGICQYDLRLFGEDVLARVLEHHCAHFAQTGSNHSTFTIRHRDYLADIVADRLTPSSKFYYVAQPRDSKEVLGWGAEATFDSAVLEAQLFLGQLPVRSSRPAASSRQNAE